MTRTCVIGMAALAVLLGACSVDNGATALGVLPKVANLTATSNPNNVLAAILTLQPTDLDSARVAYWTGTDAKQYTPYVADSGVSRMVVLGLRPATRYDFAVDAVNSLAQITSDTVAFTTDRLVAQSRCDHEDRRLQRSAHLDARQPLRHDSERLHDPR